MESKDQPDSKQEDSTSYACHRVRYTCRHASPRYSLHYLSGHAWNTAGSDIRINMPCVVILALIACSLLLGLSEITDVQVTLVSEPALRVGEEERVWAPSYIRVVPRSEC